MSAPIRVLLVDDHAVMRAGFRMILDAEPDITIVGEAATGLEAVAEASTLRPDVICMDVQMPDLDGLEATRRIIADPSSRSAVVIVTTFDRDDYLFQALDAGASGFLLKNAGPEQLVEAVRVAAAGDALLAPAVTRRVIERFARGAHAPTPPAGASGAAEASGTTGAAGAPGPAPDARASRALASTDPLPGPGVRVDGHHGHPHHRTLGATFIAQHGLGQGAAQRAVGLGPPATRRWSPAGWR